MSSVKKVVVLDVGGVIMGDLYNELLGDLLKESSKFQEIYSQGQKSWNLYKIEFDENEFWNRIIKNSPIKEELIHLKKIEKETDLLKYLKDKIRETRFQDYRNTIEFAQELSKRDDLILGILSNHANEWFQYVFEKFPELNQIFKKELIVVSCYEKQAKPYKEFYETLLNKIFQQYPEIKVEQVAFVDDKQKNVESAKELGIFGIHFHSGKNELRVLKEELIKFGIDLESE